MNPSLLPTLQKLHEELAQAFRKWQHTPTDDDIARSQAFADFRKVDDALRDRLPPLLPEIISSLQGAEEMREALERLAAWNERWPKGRIYSFTQQPLIDAELDAICTRAAALAKFSTPAPQSLGKKN